MHTIKFTVAQNPNAPDGILILWYDALGRSNGPIYKALKALLGELPGVEWAEVDRYSAQLLIARHVTDVDQVRQTVLEVLRSDEEFLDAVRLELAPEQVQFEVEPG